MNMQDQIKCATRELAMRRSVYPKLVETGRMSRVKASFETDAMAAILETLTAIEAAREREDAAAALEAARNSSPAQNFAKEGDLK